MKKVILMMTIAVFGFASANAQFEAGKKTLIAKSAGLDFGVLKFKGDKESSIALNFGIEGSYFVADNFAVKAGFSIDSEKYGDDSNTDFGFNIGAKYYLYKALYAGLSYEGHQPGYKDADFLSYGKLEIGYDYYITDNVFFEPAIYFRQGFSKPESTKFGLSIGIGVNF
jgi:hypothetical protein